MKEEEMGLRSSHANQGDQSVALDDVDKRLLELVAADGRISTRGLGRVLGMSPGAISDRIARLEREGVIRGYHADVNPNALGFGMEVIVGLQTEQGPPLDEALSFLESVPEIRQVYVVSGQWDLVLHIRVRDHEHLRDMILGRVWHVPAFRHSETLLVLQSWVGPVTWFAEKSNASNAQSASPAIDRPKGAVSKGPKVQQRKPTVGKPTTPKTASKVQKKSRTQI
jgi:DNA-binding Lrp family transcriptional regulator